MRIDPDLMRAFEAGKVAGSLGANYRANPHLYTSAMSDAWELGRWLISTARDREIAKVIGLSSRGLSYQDADGRRFRFLVSHIPSTQGHDIWRASL